MGETGGKETFVYIRESLLWVPPFLPPPPTSFLIFLFRDFFAFHQNLPQQTKGSREKYR